MQLLRHNLVVAIHMTEKVEELKSISEFNQKIYITVFVDSKSTFTRTVTFQKCNKQFQNHNSKTNSLFFH